MKLSKLQEEFITLLETTDQPQGNGALCTEDGFCCLGLWRQHIGDTYTFEGGESVIFTSKIGDVSSGTLNTSQYKELGLYSALGSPLSTKHPSLVGLNDEGNSFKDIAKILREYPEIYFTESKS